MKIRFMCKFYKNRSKEDIKIEEEEKELAKLLGKEYKPKKQGYEYSGLTQETDNVVGWNEFDEDHLSLRTKLGEVFVIKAKLEDFEIKWSSITGEDIHVI